VRGERYAVVSIRDNRVVPGSAAFASEGEAREWLRQDAASNPGRQGQLQVVPGTEVSAA
jgi:hypothetical protein